LAARLMLRISDRKLEAFGPGEPGVGVPLLINEKLDHEADRLLPSTPQAGKNTWKQTNGFMSTAFRMGLAPRPLHYRLHFISPMSPMPRASPGGTERFCFSP